MSHNNPMALFLYALKAPETRRQWPRRLKTIFDYKKLAGSSDEQAKKFVAKAKENPQWTEDCLIGFIAFQQRRVYQGEISEATVRNYIKAAKLFCEMTGLLQSINWKKITRGLSRTNQASRDRAPTLEEIRKLVEYPDLRIKPIIYVRVSSGIRIGAWDYLRWKDIKAQISDKGEVIAAKLTVYAGGREEYYSFITPEAYNALKDWMDFRGEYGEKITGDSWVMRDLWQTTNIDYGAKLGLAVCPKKFKSSGIKRLLERALWEQGVMQKLPPKVKRHEWKAAHGYRKFYKSRTEQVMKPINVEITMGHDIGVSGSYYRPTEREVLEDYVKAVDLLTINSEPSVLRKQVDYITGKTQDSEYILRSWINQLSIF